MTFKIPINDKRKKKKLAIALQHLGVRAKLAKLISKKSKKLKIE